MKRVPPLDVLVVSAHPDDAELCCGGTLAQCARRGYRVGILDLTRGETGTRGSADTRTREAACATRALGAQHRENLHLPDAALEVSLENKHQVAARLRALRPRVVILPYWESRHPDHGAASHLGHQACYLAGLRNLHLEGKPHRPFKILYATLYDETSRVQPSFIVDISRDFRRRQRAIACYRSQFTGPKQERGIHIPLTGLPARLETECRHYGELIGVQYGEPFFTREINQVDDIVQLFPRSI